MTNPDYHSLILRYKSFLQKWYKNDESIASQFNIFSILKIDWKEASVHTPFLAELLNPQGTHSQGKLFYKHFVETVLPIDDQEIFGRVNLKNLYVKDEEGFLNGKVDIFIHHNDRTNPFVILIENKILAGDQDKQLYRYYSAIINRFGTKVRVRILYLCPFNLLPSELSLPKELQEELVRNGILRTISYQEHIIKWLRRCEPLVFASNVSSTLKQYLLTLEALCNE